MCLHSGRRRHVFFPPLWAVLYEALCFGVSVGSLSADEWVCVFVLLVVQLKHPAHGAASVG